MSLGDVALAHANILVDELVSRGMRHACVSPGSRSTPLALALERDPRVQTWVHLDERSSAFFALGIAKATRRPVGVACTSGTAAAEFFPAVVEAYQSRTRLVLLTADRPPRLRGTGANQTIDQTDLFGRYAGFVELPLPADPVDGASIRRLVAPMFAGNGPEGPVHINVPFDEPLMPEGQAVAVDDRSPEAATATAPEGPGAEERASAANTVARAIDGMRGVVVIGSRPDGPLRQVLLLAGELGWPVIAEPLSGCRVPSSVGGAAVLSAGQSLIGDRTWLGAHQPECVLQFGATPTTRASQGLVAAAPHRIVVDRDHLDPDPEGRATIRLREDPEALAGEILALEHPPAPAGSDWLEAWSAADAVARAALDRALESGGDAFEPQIARDLAAAVPAGGTLFIGSSTPVRDLDLAMRPRAHLRVLGNRGASGIDGFVSTVLGAAAVAPETGSHVYALMGDLTFLHDVGGFMWLARGGPDAVLVVLDNGGGGIFGLLAQRDLPEHERLFTTPHGLDLEDVCDAAGARYLLVQGSHHLPQMLNQAELLGGVVVVHVMIDPTRAVRRRRALAIEVAEALRAETGP